MMVKLRRLIIFSKIITQTDIDIDIEDRRGEKAKQSRPGSLRKGEYIK